MATVARVEGQIYRVEGFRVRFHFQGPGRTMGRDVRGDREDVHGYGYERAAHRDWTVAKWIRERFAAEYPGFDAEVLHADGSAAHGNTLLDTVRAGYR
jgi:hypothetical protein